MLVCVCWRSGDGLWWRPNRLRNSRPELIADDEKSGFLPARSLPEQEPDWREAVRFLFWVGF